MEESNELIQERIKKLERLKESGIEPYGGLFEVKDNAADIIAGFGELEKEELEAKAKDCTIAGRIISFRDFGKTAFAHIQDGSGKIQIYLSKDVIAASQDIYKNLDIGDIVGVTGKLFRTRTNELTVQVNEMKMLCKSLRPLNEKWHGL